MAADHWAVVAGPVRDAARRAACTLPVAKVVLPSLAAFGAWLFAEGYTPDVELLADPELVERYTQVGMPGRSEATRATRRATLRRAAARIRPDSVAPLEAIAYRRARAPYSRVEVARFFEVAAAQPTRARRKSLSAILVLGLGCGLHRQDLAWVRGVDVEPTAAGVQVTVIGGPRPRVVIALDAYADQLARLSRAAANGLMIGGTTLGRVNVTAPTLDRMMTDRSVPRVVPSRLRATWLVTHLNLRTPYSVLLPAAGMTSSRTLDDLLPYSDPVPAGEAATLLRGLPA